MRPRLHIVLAANSLSLPRPWNPKSPEPDPAVDVCYGHVYPNLMRWALEDLAPGHSIGVTNLGRHSATMTHIADQAVAICCLYEPSLLIVHQGIVECWLLAKSPDEVNCPIEEFEASADRVIATRDARRPDCPVVFIDITPTNGRRLAKFPTQNQYVERYNAILRKAARRPNCFLVETARLFGEDMESRLHPDGVHLTKLGHQELARRLTKVVHARLADRIAAPGENAPDKQATD